MKEHKGGIYITEKETHYANSIWCLLGDFNAIKEEKKERWKDRNVGRGEET